LNEKDILKRDYRKCNGDTIGYHYEAERKRVAAYYGDKEIGECCFSSGGSKVWNIDHTYVEPEYRGNEIGGQLVKNVVKIAKENQIKIVPLCPFASKEFERKPEYRELEYKKDS